MLEEDGITEEQLADNSDLKEVYFEKADFEMRNNGYKIYSTLDPTLHRAIQQRVTETQDQFGSTQTMSYKDDDGETQTIEYRTQVAGTLTENTTGKVIALGGDRDYEYTES